MSPRSLVPALAAAAVLAAAAPASAAGSPDFAPAHVVVRYDGDASQTDRAAVQKATGTGFDQDLPGGARTLTIKDGESVSETLAELRHHHHVDYAVPDYEVRAAGFIPNDPGRRTDA